MEKAAPDEVEVAAQEDEEGEEKEKGSGRLKMSGKPLTYKDAGVDVDAGNLAVKRMKGFVKSTFNKHVLTDIGNFGGLFSFDKDKFDKPVLVSSADGVGTKLKVAFRTGKHDTVGQDLVNHCVNDILVMGAKPLFFLDYIGTEKLYPDRVEGIVKGLAKACKENNCSLIGGETAELPGLYSKDEYDLAGFIVGVIEKDKILDGSKIKPGDKLIGLASNGLHTNGYSLAMKLFENEIKNNDAEIISNLMKIHASYLKPVSRVLETFNIHGMAHITGGGVIDNIERVLPKNADAKLKKGAWKILPIFKTLQEKGSIEEREMFRTFNMGIGFVVFASGEDCDKVLASLKKSGVEASVVGEVIEGKGNVNLV